MGLLDNLERGLEKAVRSAFSAGGSRAVKPVEIANALRLTMDDEALVLSEGRTFVPNVYTISFSTDDFTLARKWGSTLAEELCQESIRHAREQGYTLQGPVRVTFLEDGELRPGKLHIAVATDRTGGAAPQPDAGAAHSAPVAGGGQYPARPTTAEQYPARPVSAEQYHSTAAPQTRQSPITRPAVERPAQRPTAEEALKPVLEIGGRKYAINADSIVLGRSSNADILVEDTGVSRRHLEILTRGRHVTAVDLGSTNGFFVNGRRVNGSTVLHDGDVITMGRVRIIFRMLPEPRRRTDQGGAR